ncbi:MAG: HEPN domain-containing protein [Verrucomicrobia bacterium]|nr:HEPN domain-containing protein [Verrucomicrobiota bacterium]
MKTREDNPHDWIYLAQERLRAADALFATEGVTLSGVELLHESVERYLKAFLISRGWKLRKVHDLAFLLDECISREPQFGGFQDLAETLTEQFWAQHYPGGDLTGIGSNYPDLRDQTTRLVALVRELTEVPG